MTGIDVKLNLQTVVLPQYLTYITSYTLGNKFVETMFYKFLQLLSQCERDSATHSGKGHCGFLWATPNFDPL